MVDPPGMPLPETTCPTCMPSVLPTMMRAPLSVSAVRVTAAVELEANVTDEALAVALMATAFSPTIWPMVIWVLLMMAMTTALAGMPVPETVWPIVIPAVVPGMVTVELLLVTVAVNVPFFALGRVVLPKDTLASSTETKAPLDSATVRLAALTAVTVTPAAIEEPVTDMPKVSPVTSFTSLRVRPSDGAKEIRPVLPPYPCTARLRMVVVPTLSVLVPV